jgi:transcriptional regulator GlxA family with amidase domain
MHVEIQDQSQIQPAGRRACLHQLLIQLLRDHEQAVNVKNLGKRSVAISQAMQWMSDHVEEDLSIESIANIVELGVSRFHERFVAEVGLTPADYRSHLRVRRAQDWLRQTDKSITQISFDLGFSSSQYFATVFKKIVGKTPGQYRQSSPDSLI